MRRHPFRVLWRLGHFLILALGSLAGFFFNKQLRGRRGLPDRAAWTHAWAPAFLRALKVKVTVLGAPPDKGVLIANHLSYLDIVVLGASQPLIFVAKSEVRGWPLIGWLVRCAGTLFVNRQRRADVASVAPAFAPVIAGGVVLALFPEGTSTGGERVLPFMSSLLEPAAANQWPVTPAHLAYSLSDGSASEEVCYWRDMTFLPHFLNLLSKGSIQATLRYGSAVPPGLDRKQLAKVLHAEVSALKAEGGAQRALGAEAPLGG